MKKFVKALLIVVLVIVVLVIVVIAALGRMAKDKNEKRWKTEFSTSKKKDFCKKSQ